MDVNKNTHNATITGEKRAANKEVSFSEAYFLN
jgi:hypothetical protein